MGLPTEEVLIPPGTKGLNIIYTDIHGLNISIKAVLQRRDTVTPVIK